MSKANRTKPMTNREIERQRAWAARRRIGGTRKDAPTTPAAGGLLRVSDHVPDPADYDRLLAEAGDMKWAVEEAMLGHDPEGWVEYLPKQWLGRIAVAAWQRGMPVTKFRRLVEYCWGAGTPHVIAAAGCDLFKLLRSCDWPLIGELPEAVEVFRGARGVTVEQAGAGLCWTFDYEVACAWLRILEVKWGVRGTPVVVRRTVPRSAIAMLHVPGDLAEVVIEAEPGGVLDDAGPAEWHRATIRWRDYMVASGKMFMDDPTAAAHATARGMGGGGW